MKRQGERFGRHRPASDFEGCAQACASNALGFDCAEFYVGRAGGGSCWLYSWECSVTSKANFEHYTNTGDSVFEVFYNNLQQILIFLGCTSPPTTSQPTTSAPTNIPTPTPTNGPTTSPTDIPTPSPTNILIPIPVNEPTPSPTNIPSPIPTDTKINSIDTSTPGPYVCYELKAVEGCNPFHMNQKKSQGEKVQRYRSAK